MMAQAKTRRKRKEQSEYFFDYSLLFIVLFLLGSYDFASEKKDVIAWVGSQKLVIRWMIYMLLVWGIIFFTPTTSGKEFIYFQF